jgi:vancomycin aglycone glucosyltransferase
MGAFLSMYEWCRDVEPIVGLAVQMGALGAEARVCTPPDQEFAKLLATGVMPTGGSR